MIFSLFADMKRQSEGFILLVHQAAKSRGLSMRYLKYGSIKNERGYPPLRSIGWFIGDPPRPFPGIQFDPIIFPLPCLACLRAFPEAATSRRYEKEGDLIA